MSDRAPDENAGEGRRHDGQFPVSSGEDFLAHMIHHRTGNSAPGDVSAEVRAYLLGFTQGLLAFGHIRGDAADKLLEPFFGPDYFASRTTSVRIEGWSEPGHGGLGGGRPDADDSL